MARAVGYQNVEGQPLRVLFCFGVTQTLHDEEESKLPEILPAITEAFSDLEGRFGVRVLGTFDDDQIMVGGSPSWPWVAYILAEAPNYEAVVAVCNILRETKVGSHRLWRYMRVEARIGRKLFFGEQ